MGCSGVSKFMKKIILYISVLIVMSLIGFIASSRVEKKAQCHKAETTGEAIYNWTAPRELYIDCLSYGIVLPVKQIDGYLDFKRN